VSGGGDPAFAAPRAAFVREVPGSLPACLRTARPPLDVARARAQHAGYVAALRAAGVAVTTLPTDAACPDACFVEDVALVLAAGRAVATRPGAPARRPEVEPVARALATAGLAVGRLDRDPRATLDGGDVLRAGRTLFVGRSTRTNAAGVRALAGAARPLGLDVVPVPLATGLHLKSAATLLAPGRLVVLAGALDPAPFRAAGLEALAVDEPAGANVLALGRALLVSTAAPRTAARLAREPGLDIRLVAVDELHRADGALTCLSLRIPPPGRWCA